MVVAYIFIETQILVTYHLTKLLFLSFFFCNPNCRSAKTIQKFVWAKCEGLWLLPSEQVKVETPVQVPGYGLSATYVIVHPLTQVFHMP